MHAPTRFQEGGVQAVGYSLYAVLAALALGALTSQAVAQATPTETLIPSVTSTPTRSSPTPTSTPTASPPTPTPTSTPTASPPTPTTGAEISVVPSTASFGCLGSFDITITNTGAPGTTLVISSLTLAHYTEGWDGTGFSWDLSQVTLPASLASGVTLTIPVTFSALGQWSPSRLQLTCDSNADNARHLVLEYFGGTEAACWAPTSTPTPTPTYCPTGTLCPTSTPTPVPTGDLGHRNVDGVVYDSSQGLTAPIAGAVVMYTQLSFVHPGSGFATTGSDGHYAFQLYTAAHN